MKKSKITPSAPYMDIGSEYMKKVREENRDFIFAITIVGIIVLSIGAILYMSHTNAILTQVINQR